MPGARFSFPQDLILLSASLLLGACATTSKFREISDRELMSFACPNLDGKKVSGSIWTKIESKEMTGQFPATVLDEYPSRLAVEVTNLIGAPQAWLTVEKEKINLRFTAENQKEYARSPGAAEMLGGLPLELAARLFVGGVPCPSDDKNQDIRVKRSGDGLEVVALDLRTRASTHYAYELEQYAGRPWVREVRWERTRANSVSVGPIKIIREEPMDPDGAPRRWSASSSRGEIRVRWKDRTVSVLK